MSDVERLMRQYVERYESGQSANPEELLAEVEGVERRELEALIDAYLARAPRRRWDPDQFRESRASEVVDALDRSLAGASGLWPMLLPQMREQVRLRRRELVERLAAALGAGAQTEKVGAYYHQMEQGRLPASGVSDRVLEALGAIVGQSAESLRRAGAAIEPGPGGAEGAAAFARTATGQASPAEREALAHAAPAEPAGEAPGWDEVDRLFRGG